MLFGLVAGQRDQPGLGFRCDGRLLARVRSVIKRRQRPIGQRPLHATLDCLMMGAEAPPHRIKRRRLAVGEQHSRPFNTARWLGSRARKGSQALDLFICHRQFDRSPPSCHLITPRSANRKRGIRQQPTSSMSANFMESIV